MKASVQIAAAVEPGALHANDVLHLMRPGTLQLAALPPLSLYVHLPWCLRKCPYCDFNSHEWRAGGESLPEQRYLDALVADLDAALPLIWGRTVHTIFIGGGTPSLFSPEAIDRLTPGGEAHGADDLLDKLPGGLGDMIGGFLKR